MDGKMRNSFIFKCAALLLVGSLTGCGPAHLVQELSYKSDVDKMVSQVKASQQQCKDEMQAPELNLIRSKVELTRIFSDKNPPPFVISSNDNFATNAELPVIAKWASMRDICIQRANAFRTVPSSANPTERQQFQQQMAIGQEYSAHVGQLIVFLYKQKITYGELANREYDFSRDAMAAETALTQAIVARDEDRQSAVQQQFAVVLKGWNAYIQEVGSRQPHTN
jgi:hypothetical protein